MPHERSEGDRAEPGVDLGVEFRILGPVEVLARGSRVPLGGLKQRTLLAVLLLEANRVVPATRLVDALWGEEPPMTAGAQVQGYVSALRRALAQGPAAGRIVTRPPGYLLRVEPGELDLDSFEELAARARRALAEDRAAEAAQVCRAALELWRGPALGGVGGRLIEAAAARLEEERLALLVDRVEADLQLGRHTELVAELGALIAAHPLQEGLRCALMLALFRAGRQAEALEVFRDARRTLVDELGVEPGPELRRLHERILRGDPGLELNLEQGAGSAPEASTRPPAVPAQLPADLPDFTGRTKQVAQMRDLLTRDPEVGGLPAAVVVTAVAGKPGVGKTSLAVHVAHQLRACFPDGQLYVNLRGAGRQPADPGDVLAGFLRALGVEAGAIPSDTEERSKLYRSRLADRRILVLLDNAARERQVRPLLPGSPGCAVLVTSRIRMACLEGAHLVDLDVMEPEAAVELLSQVAGPDRVGAEPEAADELTRLCGYLPLAVRISGAKLRARPHRTLTWLCRRLGDECRRLDELAAGDLEVRASLALSYEELGPLERGAFRRLGLLEAPDVAAWVVGALLDVSVAEGEDLVDALVDAQLLEVAGRDTTGRLRYRFHDLIRLFARERAGDEESADARSGALERAFGAWLAMAEEAHAGLPRGFFDAPHSTALRWRPGGELPGDPLDWFESERLALVAAVEQSRDWGLSRATWDIAVSLGSFLKLRGYFDDWQRTFEVALSATHATGDRRGEAAVLWGLGELHTFQDRYDTSLGYLEGARAIFAELGDRYGEAGTAAGCGLVCRVRGNHAAALEWFGRALTISRESGLSRSEAYALIGMGAVQAERGSHGAARDCFDGALAICREERYRDGEAQALWRLGRLEQREGRLDAAGTHLRAALGLWAELGYRLGSAHAGQSLGELALAEGRTEDAERLLARALEVYRDLGDRHGEALTLRCSGEAHLARGHLAEATGCLEEALSIWRELRVPIGEARTLVVLGDVRAATGESEAARAAWNAALRLLHELDAAECPEQAEVAQRLQAAG